MRSRFVLIYVIIQIAKELCRVVLLNLEKNRRKTRWRFHCHKGTMICEKQDASPKWSHAASISGGIFYVLIFRYHDWGFNHQSYYDAPDSLMEKISEAAKQVKAICFPLITDEFDTYTLSELCDNGVSISDKLILFNATTWCDRSNADARAIVEDDTGSGTPTAYWFDKYIKYEPNSQI